MGVVAVDRSGNLTDSAFYVVAVRKEIIQEHRGLEVRQTEFQFYMRRCKSLNYKEKISAAFIFEALRPIIRPGDSVEIDRDFLGYHADEVKLCLKRLLNKFKNSDPCIHFHSIRTNKGKKFVKEADKKSKLARTKELRNPPVKKCPDLSAYIDALKKY
ncbi:MAG: hypothetical protein ACE14S_10475 [Candidatus Bathyarchaeia archaeon]